MSRWAPVAPTERFFEKVHMVPEAGCWLWAGAWFQRGYGSFHVNSRPMSAHRFSWELHFGEITNGLHVLHKCDTPACVNPAHLYLGTDKDNVRDMLIRGRHNPGRRDTCKKFGHPLVWKARKGEKLRKYCRICNAEQQISRRQRNR